MLGVPVIREESDRMWGKRGGEGGGGRRDRGRERTQLGVPVMSETSISQLGGGMLATGEAVLAIFISDVSTCLTSVTRVPALLAQR